MFKFKLVPKNGKGCEWYCNQPFGSRYVRGYSLDGFETIIEVKKYRIVRL